MSWSISFFIAVVIAALAMLTVAARYAAASGRYDKAIRRLADRPARLPLAGSPLAMMRAVNADLADRDELDRMVVSGAIDDPEIQEMHRIQSIRLRQCIAVGIASFLGIIPVSLALYQLLGP